MDSVSPPLKELPTKKIPNDDATIAAIIPAIIRTNTRGTEAAHKASIKAFNDSMIPLTIFLIHSALFLATCSVLLASAIFSVVITACLAVSSAVFLAYSVALTLVLTVVSAFRIVRTFDFTSRVFLISRVFLRIESTDFCAVPVQAPSTLFTTKLSYCSAAS